MQVGRGQLFDHVEFFAFHGTRSKLGASRQRSSHHDAHPGERQVGIARLAQRVLTVRVRTNSSHS